METKTMEALKSLKGRSLMEPFDFSVEELEALFCLGDDIIDQPQKYAHICDNKILATLFYEPSTRTRLSFETAMCRLGGKVIGFADPKASSVSKGETIGDTARIISGYADIIAMRHFVEGAPKAAAMASTVPVINAGDGGHQHPTQTLADLMTIHRLKGHFDNLTIGMCGDLKYGRTVHSLLKAMSRYENVKFVFIAPDELKMPQDLIDELGDSISFVETKSMEEAMPQLDVLYMTRVQQERFDDVEQYERLKDSYILDKAKMALGKEDMMVLHPLPRVNEIEFDVDEDPRALYFDQAIYGMYVRMALIVALLGLTPEELTWEKTKRLALPVHPEAKEVACTNPKCVTNNDRAVKSLARPTEDGHWACEYCDTVIK
ncbi:MAG: aspartate carbamoyltransferase [Firmicutes bacterium]|nr:aspartate carbamoyltransferase [Bacillota bacterium]